MEEQRRNEERYEIPEEFVGPDAVVIYQTESGEYTFQLSENYREDPESYLHSENVHTGMGDRKVLAVEGIKWEKCIDRITGFVDALDPNTRVEAKDIRLEDIFARYDIFKLELALG